jgi:hypothetical protein
VDIRGGDLSLLPWETTLEEEKAQKEAEQKAKDDPSAFRQAANTSASVVKGLLTTPARMLTGSAGASEPTGDRFFSDEPIDTGFMRSNNGRFRIALDKVTSLEGSAEDLSLDITLQDAHMDIIAKAADLNGGPASFELTVDASGEVPSGTLRTNFRNVFRSAERNSYPRSGHFDLDTRGSSEAELAANLNGVAYLEFGRGPMDYGGLSLLTADVGAAMFRALIPGAATRQPEMFCAVTIVGLENGVGITPFGYAARTRTANLIGRIEADFNTERLKIQFDSRNRGGSGLAVGNVFSNTVRIEGTLTDPSIVPNATGLLWRGWAAFMTAGLSLVGESMVKRVLAADDPCGDLKTEMRKTVCGTDRRLAESPMVCPAADNGVSDSKPAKS